MAEVRNRGTAGPRTQTSIRPAAFRLRNPMVDTITTSSSVRAMWERKVAVKMPLWRRGDTIPLLALLTHQRARARLGSALATHSTDSQFSNANDKK